VIEVDEKVTLRTEIELKSRIASRTFCLVAIFATFATFGFTLHNPSKGGRRGSQTHGCSFITSEAQQLTSDSGDHHPSNMSLIHALVARGTIVLADHAMSNQGQFKQCECENAPASVGRGASFEIDDEPYNTTDISFLKQPLRSLFSARFHQTTPS
jgi:hypothetical protein